MGLGSNYVDNLKASLRPRMIAGEEIMFAENRGYRLFVIKEGDGINGYRLRPIPVDPQTDYTNLFKDWTQDNSDSPEQALLSAVEEFRKLGDEMRRNSVRV